MASILKVDTIQDQAGNNIISENANVITIGASGDTITVPAGATVSGFTSAGIDDNATSTAITIDSSERVGIGTSSPTQKLDIDTGYLNFTNNYGIEWGTSNAIRGNSAGRIVFRTADSESMRIESGNVGIGTSSPNVDLNVVASNGGNVEEIFELRNNSTTAGTGSRLRFTNSTVAGTTGNSVSISSYRNSDGDQDLIFETIGSERMRLSSDGVLGIGAVPPSGTSSSSYSQLQVGNSFVVDSEGTNSSFQLLQNAYVGSGNNNYATVGSGTSHANRLMMTSGIMSFSRAYPVTADSQITWSESMRIANNGNVGIGTSSPDAKLDVQSQINVTDTANNSLQALTGSRFGYSATYRCLVIGGVGTGATKNIAIGYDPSGNTDGSFTGNGTEILFKNGVEFMTPNDADDDFYTDVLVMKNGKVNIGTSTATRKFNVYSTGEPPARFQRQQGDNNLRTHLEFIREGSTVGEIQCTNTSTTYATSSDYRLKENVVDMTNATDRLKQLQPKRFNFIADADTTVDGFLAHEVSSIVPEAISGTKDATETKEKVVVNTNGQVIAENIEQADWETGKIADEDGNTKYPTDSTWEATKVVPVYQGIDQSKLVPVLTKALQEAVDKIEELEARITTLEANNP